MPAQFIAGGGRKTLPPPATRPRFWIGDGHGLGDGDGDATGWRPNG